MKHASAFLLLALPLALASVTVAQHDVEALSLAVRLTGANPGATSAGIPPLSIKPKFLTLQEPGRNDDKNAAVRFASYRNVYPGIDLHVFRTEHQFEYVFVVSPGSDPSLIRVGFSSPQTLTRDQAGNVVLRLPNGEVVQSTPTVFLTDKDSSRQIDALYSIGPDNSVGLHMGREYNALFAKLNSTVFNVVPAGGQPGGPDYPFYTARYETTAQQFLNFLNSAESNPDSPRSANMFFDRSGNVWINPAHRANRDEMFDISDSTITYDPVKPAGSRYDHYRLPNGVAPYTNHPISGVSWFGAVKYCNWLTIDSGRGEASLCYREGTNALDWAPIAATNWSVGCFSNNERRAWLSVKGFRLPMVNVEAPVSRTNEFNEFLKASTWCGSTNSVYGFGSDTFDGTEANCRGVLSPNKDGGTMPVGFFDGLQMLGKHRTRPNGNFFGLHDLTGNAAEWATDLAFTNSTDSRLIVGGSWAQTPKPAARTWAAPPFMADIFSGFRVSTTHLPMESLHIHMLFSFFMEPTVSAAKKPEGAIEPKPLIPSEPEEPPSTKPLGPAKDLSVPPPGATPPGLTYGTVPQVIPPVVAAPASPPSGGAGEVSPAVPPPGEPDRGGSVTSPPPAAVTNTLTVQSFNPNAGIAIVVAPADLQTNANGSTTFRRYYLQGSTVNLAAPVNAGGNVFQRWLRDGFFYSLNPNISVLINANITMTAVYAAPPLSVTLAFNPNNIIYAAPGSSLVATPMGGTGVYTDYRYEFILLHHVWNPQWVPSAMTGATNVFDWNYSIQYRVMVQDSSGTWSPWSNTAVLTVGPPPIPDPSMTQPGL